VRLSDVPKVEVEPIHGDQLAAVPHSQSTGYAHGLGVNGFRIVDAWEATSSTQGRVLARWLYRG
jgi:hypothetical protein